MNTPYLLFPLSIAMCVTLVTSGQWTAELQVPATDVPGLLADDNGIRAGTDERVYRSPDGAAFLAGEALPGAPAFIDALVRVGSDLYAGTGGNGLFVSNDEGQSWQDLSQGLTGLGGLHLSAVAAFNGELYCATMGAGVFKRVGDSWQPFGGLGGNTTANVGFLKVLDGRLYAGAGGNGYLWRLDPGTTTFAPVQVGALMAAPFVITDILRLGDDLLVGSTYGLYRSTDDGDSWAPVNNGPVAGERLMFLDAGTTVFVLVSGGISRLYRSVDQGGSWELLDVMPTTYAIAQHGGRLYAGRTDGLWYRDDLRVGLPDAPGDLAFAVFPVPARDVLHLVADHPGIAHYRVFDLQGRMVQEGSLAGPRAQLDLQPLTPGTYVLHLIQGGRSGSRRIVVE